MSKIKKTRTTDHRVLLAHGHPIPALKPCQGSEFDVPVVPIGSTAHVKGYIDQALNQAQATVLANAVLNEAEAA